MQLKISKYCAELSQRKKFPGGAVNLARKSAVITKQGLESGKFITSFSRNN